MYSPLLTSFGLLGTDAEKRQIQYTLKPKADVVTKLGACMYSKC